MIINANTKIAKLLKHNEKALEAIVSITPKFEKLRNPFLRKLMANRTSIGMAAKIGGCSVDEFIEKLKPLGFEAGGETVTSGPNHNHELAKRIDRLDPKAITDLDVRPIIESGEDPLRMILATVKEIQPGNALKIINTFEPTPLIKVLEKKGFQSHIRHPAPELVEAFFYLPENKKQADLVEADTSISEDWEGVLANYESNLDTVDVRQMEMPQPMLTILSKLEGLESGKALYVYHKRVPVFLLPELKERGFDLRIKTISESEVHLLIFRD